MSDIDQNGGRSTALSGRSQLDLVVSTLGRVDRLRKLLDSVAPQLDHHDGVTIVAQENVRVVESLLDELRPHFRCRVHIVTSVRGASIGRNVGARACRADAPGPESLLMFPNDSSWFPEGSLDAIRLGLGSAPAGGVVVATSSGPRFMLPPLGAILDKTTVWSVIEMGLVIRRELFDEMGGFTETIGTGASTPWQAGEVTDLLLRALAAHPPLRTEFRWIRDPAAVVGGIPEGADLSVDERAWKLRAYGRGIAHVYRIHRYPIWRRISFILAGTLVGIRRRGEYRFRDGLPASLGRLEGTVGRVIGRGRSAAAVSR